MTDDLKGAFNPDPNKWVYLYAGISEKLEKNPEEDYYELDVRDRDRKDYPGVCYGELDRDREVLRLNICSGSTGNVDVFWPRTEVLDIKNSNVDIFTSSFYINIKLIIIHSSFVKFSCSWPHVRQISAYGTVDQMIHLIENCRPFEGVIKFEIYVFRDEQHPKKIYDLINLLLANKKFPNLPCMHLTLPDELAEVFADSVARKVARFFPPLENMTEEAFKMWLLPPGTFSYKIMPSDGGPDANHFKVLLRPVARHNN